MPGFTPAVARRQQQQAGQEKGGPTLLQQHGAQQPQLRLAQREYVARQHERAATARAGRAQRQAVGHGQRGVRRRCPQQRLQVLRLRVWWAAQNVGVGGKTQLAGRSTQRQWPAPMPMPGRRYIG